jgi:hypothetical protein
LGSGGGCGSGFGGRDPGMGNASAKEGDNGGHMAASPPPDAVMLERPPHVPCLFTPQVMMTNYPKRK